MRSMASAIGRLLSREPGSSPRRRRANRCPGCPQRWASLSAGSKTRSRIHALRRLNPDVVAASPTEDAAAGAAEITAEDAAFSI